MSRLLITHFILLTLAVPLGAGQGKDPVFRSGASLVALNVSVMDGGGRRFVTDLSRNDFKVFEDGVEQQVSFFESSLVPVDLVLMLDTSSSMSDKMPVVQQAAINFLRTLRAGDRGA